MQSDHDPGWLPLFPAVAGVREQANDAVAACEQEADARQGLGYRAYLKCVLSD